MSLRTYRPSSWLASLLAAVMVLMPVAAFAQTKISYHKNKYQPSDDVKVGRQAAAEVEKQMPLLRDQDVTSYVESVGQRLVASIPPEFQHPEFRYYFKVVNARDINAFALPGGPMFVNRGMIEAARNEGEMAGVMAHELSHVALRHGTAQATKAQSPSILAGIGAIGGAILGGPLGQVVSAGSQLGAGAYLLKFSREYETEADLLGARIMARAGYDPHDLANMFKTLEAQGSSGGGFLSDHPSPRDRYARINQEAQALQVSPNAIHTTAEFRRIQERLHGFPPAPSMQDIARSGQRYPDQNGNNNYPSNSPTGRVSYPSTRYRSYSEFGAVTLSIPDNWRELADQGGVWFAPEGAYGSANGQTVYTHGVNVGTTQTRSRNLQQSTDELISNFEQSSPNLRARGGYQRVYLDGRNALLISLSNMNEANGRPEVITVTTTQLRNGDLFFVITVNPENETNAYQNAFANILRSIRLNG